MVWNDKFDRYKRTKLNIRMKIKQKQITVPVNHPMEDYLNLPEGSTVDTHTERETELSKAVEYDEKDNELEETYQEVYDKAITGYDNLTDEMEVSEPKFLARLGEVSVSYLKTALDAASMKARLKEHKDKMSNKSSSPKNVTTNQTIIVSREQLLATLSTKTANKNNDVIDVEHIQIEGNKNEKDE